MESPHALNPLQEEYLVIALRLQKQKLRVTTVAFADQFRTHMCFARAAVSALTSIGLLEFSVCRGLRLTLEGEMRARDIDRRRTAVAHAMSTALQVDWMTAEEAALGLRRVLSRSEVNRIMCFMRPLRRAAFNGNDEGPVRSNEALLNKNFS